MFNNTCDIGNKPDSDCKAIHVPIAFYCIESNLFSNKGIESSALDSL